MTIKMESPATSAKVNGAKKKAGGLQAQEYRAAAVHATTFEHIGLAAYRVAHLVARANLDPTHAALLAGLIFGEGRV